MFDKLNITGFIYVSHYLLTIFDVERFKKLVEWPVICKKTLMLNSLTLWLIAHYP